MDPDFHRAAGQLDHRQLLDPVAKVMGILDVRLVQAPDAFHMDLIHRHLDTIGQRGQDGRLVRRVIAINVEARIGLRVTGGLGFLERMLERDLFALHLGQDVVAGPVQDPVDAVNPVAHKPLAQGADDRYAAGNAGLEPDSGLIFGGQGEDFLAMFRQEGLVRRHHGLAKTQGAKDKFLGNPGAPHQLDHDIHCGVIND